MLFRSLDAEGISDYQIVPIPDTHVHSVWVGHVMSLVPAFDAVYSNSALVIRLFKERGVKVESLPMTDRKRLSGTEIRRRIHVGENWASLVPEPVARFINEIDGVSRIKETFRYSTPYGTRENDA